MPLSLRIGWYGGGDVTVGIADPGGRPARRVEQVQDGSLQRVVEFGQQVEPLPVERGEMFFVMREVGRTAIGRDDRLPVAVLPPLRIIDADFARGRAHSPRVVHRDGKRHYAACREDVAAVAVALLEVMLVQVDAGLSAQQFRIVLQVAQVGRRKQDHRSLRNLTGVRMRNRFRNCGNFFLPGQQRPAGDRLVLRKRLGSPVLGRPQHAGHRSGRCRTGRPRRARPCGTR